MKFNAFPDIPPHEIFFLVQGNPKRKNLLPTYLSQFQKAEIYFTNDLLDYGSKWIYFIETQFKNLNEIHIRQMNYFTSNKLQKEQEKYYPAIRCK